MPNEVPKPDPARENTKRAYSREIGHTLQQLNALLLDAANRGFRVHLSTLQFDTITCGRTVSTVSLNCSHIVDCFNQENQDAH